MSHFVDYFVGVRRGEIVLKKKENEPIDSMRSRDNDLHINLDQLISISSSIYEAPLGVFSILKYLGK